MPFFAWGRSVLDVILTTMNRTDRPLFRDMCQCMFLLLYVPVVVLSAYQPFSRRKILCLQICEVQDTSGLTLVDPVSSVFVSRTIHLVDIWISPS